MKTKFAVVRHKGNEEVNSEFIKKMSKCSNVVMLGVDLSDRRRSKVKCKSIIEENWSNFEAHDLVNADRLLKNAFYLLNPYSHWDDNGRYVKVKEEIFMFTSDANASYISIMKDDKTSFYPFELTKQKFAKLEKFSERIDVAKTLFDPYLKNKEIRARVCRKFKFDKKTEEYLTLDVLKVENEICGNYKRIFSDLYDFLENKLFVGWK